MFAGCSCDMSVCCLCASFQEYKIQLDLHTCGKHLLYIFICNPVVSFQGRDGGLNQPFSHDRILIPPHFVVSAFPPKILYRAWGGKVMNECML